jgi:simple sugar transport system permease protein
LIAAIAGAGFALLHAFFAIHLRADQIVGGTAINFLALGVTGYFFIQVYGANGTPGNLPRIPDANIPGLKEHTFWGDAIGHLNYMIWASFVLLIVAHVVLFRTPIGLRLRAVGEHPRAADTVGISVYLTRYLAVITSGVLAALGGAYLSIGFVGSFGENMTAGRGFIALAAVIFGRWTPWGATGAAIFFGFFEALQYVLQGRVGWIPADAMQAVPYVAALVAIAGLVGKVRAPAADGIPY